MTAHTAIDERFVRRFEQRALEITGVRLAAGWFQRAAETFPRVMEEHSGLSWEHLERLIEQPRSGAALIELLVGEVTVKETRLFRDVGQMRALLNVVLPVVCEESVRRGTQVRVWSAGCATGEEAYSVAMLAADVTEDGRLAHYAILGSDISSSAIARARKGAYPQPGAHWGAHEFTPLLDRYTSLREDGMRVAGDELRRRTRFAVHNLLSGPPVCGQDVVLCRNVMVYLPHEARVALVQRLWDSLNPGGWLLTGEADLIHLVPSGFETWNHECATMYRKPPCPAADGGAPRG